ncbi:Aspartyl-tRNA(Asn) amidotransferase subunit B / Glutamyl-tRNA(Gln) amidotransferase subunit B [Streptococcus gordonii]|uniref:Aspartyl-tRNA(Asn) amidotransferase subunit B / Glutamyl-tRNA(Gln) amidotransferase subunit B n=1 Tax=Streptococcus gordonii TaxID=1302 RepID=A0A139N727_STRGN|nr:Aspartyl-tRNA(Asn) amidotransferase subunit B / Glutamyl-tRNA(Gln) amidotransferase subunit B [Streptococcus gordonii]
MKHLSKLIVLLLGGLLIMVSLGVCGEKIPENRTKEQYELEKEFQPLFDF